MKRTFIAVIALCATVVLAQNPVRNGYVSFGKNEISVTFAVNTTDTIKFALPPTYGPTTSPWSTGGTGTVGVMPIQVMSTGNECLTVELTSGNAADSIDTFRVFGLDSDADIIRNDSLNVSVTGVNNPGDGQVKRYSLVGQFAPGYHGIAVVFQVADLTGGNRVFRFRLSSAQ